jgi:4-diphosphocytidyl-2-C-methyl-D-erythritol kinase
VHVLVHSHAKINLYLDVLAPRSDGYHDIETIFQSLALHDSLYIETSPETLQLHCSDPALGHGPENLAYRAAALLRARAGVKTGAILRLEKRIPVAAGLAGGSGNAAATLAGLNRAWALGLSDAALAEIALELGSDVPYCLHGGTMAATGRGELLEPLAPLPERAVVLVNPGIAIHAGAVYAHPLLRKNTAPRKAGKTSAFRQILHQWRPETADQVLFNAMEVPVFHDYPEIAAIKLRLLELGCTAAMMSGSGSTVFGFCAPNRKEAEFRAAFPGCYVCLTQTVSCGLRFGP